MTRHTRGTTRTIDADLMARLKEEAPPRRAPFRDVANAALRRAPSASVEGEAPHVTLFGFVRVTNRRSFDEPRSVEEARA